jgi:hypothetical protein
MNNIQEGLEIYFQLEIMTVISSRSMYRSTLEENVGEILASSGK